MLDRFQKNVVDRLTVVAGAVESLCTRALTLGNCLKQFKGELPSKLKLEIEEMQLAVTQLRQELEIAKALRIERDAAFLRYTHAHTKNIQTKTVLLLCSM